MHASRRILLKHFNARAAEYHDEMVSDDALNDQHSNSDDTNKPVSSDFPLTRLVNAHELHRSKSSAGYTRVP